jgi:hypothetical protein
LSRWSSWIVNAVQLGVTFYVNRAIEPKLKNLVDPLPVISPPLVTLILSGLIVVILTDLTVHRPRLVFRWSEPYDRTAFQPEIELRPPQPRGIDLQVELVGKSILTRLLRKSFRRPGVVARVELGSRDAIQLRGEKRTAQGVVVDDDSVTIPFPAQGTSWVTMSAEVTERAPNHLSVTVEHRIETSGFRRMLARLVVKQHNVTTLRVIRTS